MAMQMRRPRGMRRYSSPFEEWQDFVESALAEWPFPATWWRRPRDATSWVPTLDVYEKENTYIVRAEVPGVKMEDIDISMSGDTLIIKGERKAPEDMKSEESQRSEICYGSFSRSVTLPEPVKADKIEATIDNGILEIRLPKVPEAQPKRIEIKTKA